MSTQVATMVAVEPSRIPGWTVEEHREDALSALAPEWDALVARSPQGAPFALSGWTRAWRESFAPASPLRVLCARRAGEAEAFAPFLERRGRLARVPVRLWQSPSNEHSQRVEWALGARPEEAVGAIWRNLREQPWEVLLLKDLVVGGPVESVIGQSAEKEGFLVTRWTSLESPWLPVLPEPELDQSLEAKFRANVRRRKKKLAQKGALRLERVEGGAALEATLERGFALEGGGWKGERGTAIRSRPETQGFYLELARQAAAGGWLALYTLYAGDRPVAFHYALDYRGTYLLLKPGYDESLGDCSPGQLLVDEVLKDLARRGAREFDFLGPTMTWKRDWTERLRAHCWLFVVRPTAKGRLLHAARFRYGPQAARLARRVTAWRR